MDSAGDVLAYGQFLAVAGVAMQFGHITVPSIGSQDVWYRPAILLLPACAIALWYAQTPAGTSFGHDLSSSLLIALSGVLTAVPLLLFAIAARRMDYSTMGFLQFLAPTIVFLLGLFVFHEPLRPVQLASFIAIWCAIALFVWDLFARRKA